MVPTTTASKTSHSSAVNPWLVLITVMVGTVLIGLDRTVVNLAIPDIINDFGITVTTAAWIATAYIISNAVFVPVFGKLGDLFGNRIIYLWSFVGFIVVSLLAGLSWNFGSLVTFRLIQGFVGAAVYPTAMSLIAKSFPNTRMRAQALGIWASSFAVSAVIGPLIGGYLVDNFTWRAVFYINLPIGIVGLLMTLFLIPRDKPEERGSFDWLGSLLLAGAISSIVLVLDQGQIWGWLSFVSWLCYIGTVVFSILVYIWETRHSHPIIDFSLFKNRTISSVLAVSFISFGGLMGAMFLLPIFTQRVLGYDAVKSGLVLIPMALALPIFAPLGAWLAQKFNPRWTVSAGMFVAAYGLYLLHTLNPTMGSYNFILPLALFGAGIGLGLSPMTNASTTAVPLHQVGMSSGLLNLARNIGGAFGIALFGTALSNAINSNILNVSQNSHILGHTTKIISEGTRLIIMKANMLAYGTVFEYAAISVVVGGLLALFFLRTDTHTQSSAIKPQQSITP